MTKYIYALMFAMLGSSVAEKGFITHTAASPLYTITRSVEDLGARISNFFSKVGSKGSSQNTSKITRSKTEGDEGFKGIFNNNNFNMFNLMGQQNFVNSQNYQDRPFSQNLNVPQALNLQHYLNNFESRPNLNQTLLNNRDNNSFGAEKNIIKIDSSNMYSNNKAKHNNITHALNGTAPVMVTLPFFDKGLNNSGLNNITHSDKNNTYLMLQNKMHDDRLRNLNLMAM